MQAIADRYGLRLADAWNTELMPHLGRHPNAYHEFVLDGMETAARQAGSNQAKFLELLSSTSRMRSDCQLVDGIHPLPTLPLLRPALPRPFSLHDSFGLPPFQLSAPSAAPDGADERVPDVIPAIAVRTVPADDQKAGIGSPIKIGPVLRWWKGITDYLLGRQTDAVVPTSSGVDSPRTVAYGHDSGQSLLPRQRMTGCRGASGAGRWLFAATAKPTDGRLAGGRSAASDDP
jgi:hypothetical protein